MTVTLRMTAEEHALLKEAADADRRSLNAFAVRALLRQARAVLRQESRGAGDGR